MNDYNLREGDIFKIGRIIVRIRTIKFAKNNNKNNDNKNLKKLNRINYAEYAMEKKKMMKILYCNLVLVQVQ